MNSFLITKENSIFSTCKKCNKFAKGKIWKSEVFFPKQEGMYTDPKTTYIICANCAKTKDEAKEIMVKLFNKQNDDYIKTFCGST